LLLSLASPGTAQTVATPPAPGAATASPAPVEEILITGAKTTGGEFGTKSGIPIAKIPQSVQVLGGEDIALRGFTNVGDALRSVPSANVGAPRTSDYQSFSLKVRGFLADQMRNGVRQRYYEDVDASALSNVDRIEVLKGPSSVLFGQSAQGGVLSIVTKRPEREWGGSLSFLAGSFQRYAGSFDVTGPLSEEHGLYFRATGELERAGTYADFQDLDRENAALSLTWEATERATAYLVTEWVERRTLRNPGLPLVGTVQPNGIRPVPRSAYLAEPRSSDLNASAPLVQAWVDVAVSDAWTLTPRVSYNGFDTDFTQIRVRAVDPDGRTVNRTGRFGKEDDEYLIAQLDLQGELELLGTSHRVLAGLEYDRERSTFLQQTLTNIGPIDALAPAYQFDSAVGPSFAFAFDGSFDVDGWALYLQDVADLTERWSVVLGVRASWFDWTNAFFEESGAPDGPADAGDTDDLSYQVGATFRLTDAWSLFGGYNTGFDVEISAGTRLASGEPVKPETSDQGELGVRYASEALDGSFSLFQVRRRDVLTADPDPLNAGFSVQTGELRARGIELELTAHPFEGVTLQAGYAYLDADVTESNDGDEGGRLEDVADHQANFYVRYELSALPLSLWAGLNYVGARALVNQLTDPADPLFPTPILDSYVAADVGGSYTLGRMRFDLAISNLADERYFVASGNAFAVYPGEPRQASFRVTYDF
jgi:iron complex outermembrane receptor protein